MISMNGYNEKHLTFTSNATLKAGTPVTVSGDFNVAAAAKNAAFVGFADGQRGEYVTVKLSGYTECTYTGDAPSYGAGFLIADTNGAVASATDGTAVTVVHIDTANKKVGFIF